MSNEITIEKIDAVIQRVPSATYAEAKQALIDHNGDVIESIIALESNKTTIESNLSKKTKQAKKAVEDMFSKDSEDFKEMKESDVVLAFPGNPISGGVHIELGWASALNKKIYLFLEKNASYSPLIEGMKTITDVRIVELPENYTIETVLNAVEEI